MTSDTQSLGPREDFYQPSVAAWSLMKGQQLKGKPSEAIDKGPTLLSISCYGGRQWMGSNGKPALQMRGRKINNAAVIVIMSSCAWAN